MAKEFLYSHRPGKIVLLLFTLFFFNRAASQHSIFSSSSQPSIATYNVGQPIEVGVKFRANQPGYITGIRFYKGSGNTGTHVGHLWSRTGSKLAEATFTNETASGWQQVNFSSPVAISAGTTYVASYFSSAGKTALSYFGFISPVINGPLRALSNGEDGSNGVYRISSSSGFPTHSILAVNFWVDVVFMPANTGGGDNTPPSVRHVSPSNYSINIDAGTTVSAVFSEDIDAATINSSTFELRESGSNRLVDATVVYDESSKKAILYPSSILNDALFYTAKIKGGSTGVKDLAGNAMVNNYSWTFIMIPLVDHTQPVVLSVSPPDGETDVSTDPIITAVFSEKMKTSTITASRFELKSESGSDIPFSVSYEAGTRTAVITPSASLTAATVYNVAIKGGYYGVKDAAGNSMSGNHTWSFTTIDNSAPPVTIFAPTDLPDVPLIVDQPVEVGVKFRSSQNGLVKGIRFYKGEGNTGTHIGHLWSSTGDMLGEVTFTGETASGWQEALFDTPVAISADVTYVASYFSSEGKYSFSNSYFITEVVNGPLRALADGADGGNGVYVYTSTSAFPTNTFMATNYYADVVFVAEAAAARMITGTETPADETSDPLTGNKPVFNNDDPAQGNPTIKTDKLPAAGSRTRPSASDLNIRVMPNPGTHYFNIVINSDDANPVSVRISDMTGRLIEMHERVASTGVLRVGQTWSAGTYLAEVIQGKRRQVLKLVKIN